MVISAKLIPLSDGNDMPSLGLAAFRRDNVDHVKQVIRNAWNNGIRHYVIAELFGNGHTIIETLNELGAKRDEYFITLKIWPKDRKPLDLTSAFKMTLAYIGLESVDLLLTHAPIDVENRAEQWVALEGLQEQGLCKSLGISNLTTFHLTDLLKNAMIVPSVFESEYSPFYQKTDLIDLAVDSSMNVMVQEFLSKGMRIKSPKLLNIIPLQYQDIPIEQIMARWAITKGCSVMLPADIPSLNVDSNIILEPLPTDLMNQFAELDEDLLTIWTTSFVEVEEK